MASQMATSTPLMALTAAPPPKGRVRLYISSQSTSTSNGSRPTSIGLKQNSTNEAANSGGCSPWHRDSPQPEMPSSVLTSTTIALRLSTHPCENAKGSSRSEEHTSELQSRQYLVCRLMLEKKNRYMFDTQWITLVCV